MKLYEMKPTNNQIVFLIFIVTVFFMISHQFIKEPFTSKHKKTNGNKNKKEKIKKTKIKKTTKKNKQKQKKNKKEDFINTGISNLFNGFMQKSKEKKHREATINKINKREKERHNMINNQPSKNTTDSMHKFGALKQGLYDIIEMGNIIGG